jgi:cell division protein FtsI (penicillin-binding protein 3)
VVDRSSRRKAGALVAVFSALFFALGVRLYTIQVLGHETYSARRDTQSQGRVREEIPTGPILDARGQWLALSAPLPSIWVNPSMLGRDPAVVAPLARAVNLPESEVARKLSDERLRFAWLKRKAAPAEVEAVKRLLEAPGFRPDKRVPEPRLGIRTEYVRQYPQGSLAAHVLGFESGDPAAHEGLHRSLGALIRRPAATSEVSLDAVRRITDGGGLDLAGAEVQLTLDVLLQQVVEEELDAACAEFRPRWAVAVVLDPRTGAILALANRPAFDPARPASQPAEHRLNRAIAAPYEPGSTLKPFVAAWAMEKGLIRPETRIDCENGLWKHGPRRLHDHHPYAVLSVSDIIKFSSNIGAAKIGALVLGARSTRECMAAWGFGTESGVDLPAEDGGRLFPLSKWTVYSETSVPMGHEISVTALQLAVATAAIANGGTLYRPHILKRVVAGDGIVLHHPGPQPVRRVISPRTSKEMIEILKGVVKEGTGKKSQVPGVAVAGKTGTSQKIDPVTKQYTHEKYISSFVGFAPADDATLCIAVVVDEPQGAYYGGTVAAPVVGRILQRGLAYAK